MKKLLSLNAIQNMYFTHNV